MKCDEASKCLDSSDLEDVNKEKKRSECRSSSHVVFSSDYRDLLLSAPTKGKGSSKGGGAATKKRKTESESSSRRVLVVLEGFSQTRLKEHLPPGAKCWVSRSSSSWCTRIEPWPQNCRSWELHGEHTAIFLVLSVVWRQWCDANGIAHGDSPVQGVILEESAFLDAL